MTVALPHLGGKGPRLIPLEGLRPLASANVSALVIQAGGDMEGLSRLNPTHALSIALDPCLLSPNCLTKDETAEFCAAVFQPEARKSEAKLLAGQHRIAAVQKLLKPQLKWYQEIQDKKMGNPENDHDLWEEENTVRELLTRNGIWLVKVYNLCE